MNGVGNVKCPFPAAKDEELRRTSILILQDFQGYFPRFPEQIFYLTGSDLWIPVCEHAHNPLQSRSIGMLGIFGRHFSVASVIEILGTDLLFCFLVGLIKRSLVLRVNQITRIYLRIRKLLWLSCSSSLWVVTRRITNDERSVRSRVLKRTRTFPNQLKIARYVVLYEYRKANCNR